MIARASHIRPARPPDTGAIGELIARTYARYNLGFAAPAERRALLGPFAHATSDDPEHRTAIAAAVRAHTVLVAVVDRDIVGVLRGGRLDRPGRAVLQSLFVEGSHQRQGLGRALVEEFERTCRRRRIEEVKVASTLEAVGFYARLGYRRTTGVRVLRSFGRVHLPYQPMLTRGVARGESVSAASGPPRSRRRAP